MDLSTLLLVAAVVLFVVAAFVPRSWIGFVGLACFAASFLVSGLKVG